MRSNVITSKNGFNLQNISFDWITCFSSCFIVLNEIIQLCFIQSSPFSSVCRKKDNESSEVEIRIKSSSRLSAWRLSAPPRTEIRASLDWWSWSDSRAERSQWWDRRTSWAVTRGGRMMGAHAAAAAWWWAEEIIHQWAEEIPGQTKVFLSSKYCLSQTEGRITHNQNKQNHWWHKTVRNSLKVSLTVFKLQSNKQ